MKVNSRCRKLQISAIHLWALAKVVNKLNTTAATSFRTQARVAAYKSDTLANKLEINHNPKRKRHIVEPKPMPKHLLGQV